MLLARGREQISTISAFVVAENNAYLDVKQVFIVPEGSNKGLLYTVAKISQTCLWLEMNIDWISRILR